MTNKERQNYLSKLYGIRSGMAAISVLMDGQDVIAKEINALFKDQFDASRQLENKTKNFNSIYTPKHELVIEEAKNDAHIESFRNKYQECDRDLVRIKQDIQTYQTKAAAGSAKTAISVIFSLALMALPIILFIVGITTDNTGLIWTAVLSGLLLITCGWALLVHTIGKASGRNGKGSVKYAEERYSNTLSERNKYKRNYDDCVAKKSTFAAKIAAEEAKEKQELEACKNAVDAVESKITAARAKLAAEIVSDSVAAEKAYRILLAEYKDFLHPNDWKNVDYIIYALETNRADTFKEALQYSDQEVRTDKVVEAIYEVGDSLGAIIRQSSLELRTEISIQATNMGTKLNEIKHEIKETGSKITEVIKESTYSIKNSLSQAAERIGKSIDSQTNVNKQILSSINKVNDGLNDATALFEKTNRTSQSLASDLNEMTTRYISYLNN